MNVTVEVDENGSSSPHPNNGLPGPTGIGFEAHMDDNQSLDNQSLYMGFERDKNDFLKYLTAYLDKHLDKPQYQVEPITVDLKTIQPATGLTPRCTGNVFNIQNNGVQNKHLVSYCEFINKNNQIALIDNIVSSDIPPKSLSEILTHQRNYIGLKQKLTNVYEQYIFRLEFASQENFEKYRAQGNLQGLLEEFASQNPQFAIKVVFSDGTADQRYDSFNDLLNAKPSASKTQSANAASSSTGPSSTTNINPSMKNPGLKAKIGSSSSQKPIP